MSSQIANKVKNSLYCTHYLCVPLFPSYTTRATTRTACSIFFSAYNIEQHLFDRSVQRGSSNHDYSLHTQTVFTQDLLNYYCSSSALSCLFIVHRNSLTNVLVLRTLLRLYFCLCIVYTLLLVALFITLILILMLLLVYL